MTDTLTLIQCAQGRRLAKRYTDPAVKPDDYDAGFLFQAVAEVEIDGIEALAEALAGLESDPTLAVVRGSVHPGVAQGVDWVQRLSTPREGVEAAFLARSRRWLALDVDESTEPMPAGPWTEAGLHQTVERWRETLAPGLREAGFVWQFSAKSHLSPTLRGRAWFWLAEPAADAPLRAWTDLNGLDSSLYTPVAIHYTAAPVFDGCQDPLAGLRLQVHPGAPFAVLSALDAEIEDGPAGAFRERRAGAVGRDGTDRLAPARSALLEALGDASDHQGQRWFMCGHLGGMLTKLGWPQTDVEALIADWLDSGDPGIDVSKGVQRAIDAYGLADPSTATGVAELESLLGVDQAKNLQRIAVDGVKPNARKARQEREAAEALKESGPAPAGSNISEPPGQDEDPAGPTDPLAAWTTLVDRSTLPPPLDYVYGRYDLAPGKVSSIQSFANTAKTPFALQLSICVAAGLPFLGAETRQTNVMYLAAEGGALTQEREARICSALGLYRASVPLEYRTLDHYLDERFLGALESFMPEHGIGMLTIDTYGSSIDGSIDHNSAQFSHWLKQLGRLSDATGALVLVLLHENKAQAEGLRAISGHNSAPGAIQASVQLTRPDLNERDVIEVTCTREVRRPFDTHRVRFTDPPCDGAPEGKGLLAVPVTDKPAEDDLPDLRNVANRGRSVDAQERTAVAGLAIFEALRLAPVAISREELRAIGGEGRNPADRAIRELVGAGWVEMQAGGYYVRTEAQPGLVEVKARLSRSGASRWVEAR